MFENIDRSFLTEYAPSLKRINFEEDFKNSGYTDKKEYKKSVVKDKIASSDLNNRSLKGYKYSPYESKKAPFKTTFNPKDETLKDKLNNKVYNPLKNAYDGFLRKLSSDLPNTFRDTITASAMGVQTKQTMLGRMGNIVGNSEVTGYNPISKSNINIDYLSNKIDTNDSDLKIKGSDGYFQRSFKNLYNESTRGHRERVGAKNLRDWKQMHIDETAKSVREYGANINPFDMGENLNYVKHNLKGKDGKALIQGPPERNAMYGNDLLGSIRERDALQLKEVEKRLSDAQNNVKRFFNPVDREEVSALTSMQEELTERIRRIDGNFGATRINLDALPMPKSVAESFGDLHERRVQLYDQVFSKTGNSNSNPRGSVERSGIAFPKRELADVNSAIADNVGMFDSYHVTNRSINFGSPSQTKDFTPSFGTSGYGLGFMNSVKASRVEHLTRAANFMNPLGVGGTSAMQAIGESFGIMNKAQRMQAAQARGFGKLAGATVPALGALQLGLGIYNKDDAGQIFEDIFSLGTSLAGWRVGAALGGGITKASSLSRIAGLGIGGVTGMALGYGAGVALVGGIRDITSNESKIRGFAKKAATKEASVTQSDTRQSLTARQASLQKLAKSGLNDRGLLLGNESSILAGVM